MEKNKIKSITDFYDIMRYIDYNIYQRKELLSLKYISNVFGFRPRYFSEKFIEYIGMNYADFVAKARIRRAAQEICDMESTRNAAKRYEPWIKGFPRLFKKEFGISPRTFLKENPTLPDMPVVPTINGKAVTMQYKRTNTVEITGSAYFAKRSAGDPTKDKEFLLNNVSYPFRNPGSHHDELNDPEMQWGIWWFDYCDEDKIYYVFGKEDDAYKGQEGFVAPNRIHTRIKGGNYAVFSIKKGDNYFETAANAYQLVWYVFNVWVPFNLKVQDRMGFTYEMFDRDHVWLYLPLLRGMGGIQIKKSEPVEIDDLAEYIDENILYNITVNQVVDYSEKSSPNVRNQFMSCYRISISDYILGRKCLILREMLDKGKITEEDLKDKYHYESLAALEEDYLKVKKKLDAATELTDFDDYYEVNHHNLKIDEETLEDFDVIGKCIVSGSKTDEDVPGITAFWMEHEFEEIRDTPYAGNKDTISFCLTELTEERKSNPLFNYYLGAIALEDAELPEGMKKIHMAGGKYMVFSLEKTENEELSEVYRALYLMIYQVWAKRNRVLLDIVSRISFYRYKDGVLYCYLPVF